MLLGSRLSERKIRAWLDDGAGIEWTIDVLGGIDRGGRSCLMAEIFGMTTLLM
jgi:hypothetical protein